MDNDSGTFDMTKELVSESYAFRSTLDQSRNISNYKTTIFSIDNTKIWTQGCKMVVGNLWLSIGDTGKECGFSNIRKSNKTYICDYFQLQKNFQFLRRLSWLCIFRNLHGCSRIMLVSFATSSAS